MLHIETERLILREYKESDWSEVHEYTTDPEVVKYMLWGPNSEADTKNFIQTVLNNQQANPRTNFEVAAVDKSLNRIIGGIGIRIKNERRKEADLGYCYSRTVWGKGYGTEAARAMMKFGFEHLGMHRIWATCDADNHGSEGVMKKLGMRKEAHFKQDELIKGQWRDSFLYAILDWEWKELNAGEGIEITYKSVQAPVK